jgi:hypothetical protein
MKRHRRAAADEAEEEEEEENEDDEDHDDESYSPRKRPFSKTAAPTSRRGTTKKERHNSTPEGRPVTRQGSRKRPRAQSSAVAGSSALPRSHGLFACQQCSQSNFKNVASLDSHVKKQHRRPFICVFHFAGCESTFASKNEWKRHVMSQHLMLEFWLCTEGNCNRTEAAGSAASARRSTSAQRRLGHASASMSRPSAAAHSGGAVFNRKDLHRQHLCRMHMPKRIKQEIEPLQKVDKSASTAEWNEMANEFQKRAHRVRCDLPTYMTCPVAGCDADFTSENAWDQRMEHMARHLEQAAVDKEPPVGFGGGADPTLMQWALRPDVAVIRQDDHGRWVQNNPLKTQSRSGSGRSTADANHDQDLDADGEDEEDFLGE